MRWGERERDEKTHDLMAQLRPFDWMEALKYSLSTHSVTSGCSQRLQPASVKQRRSEILQKTIVEVLAAVSGLRSWFCGSSSSESSGGNSRCLVQTVSASWTTSGLNTDLVDFQLTYNLLWGGSPKRSIYFPTVGRAYSLWITEQTKNEILTNIILQVLHINM